MTRLFNDVDLHAFVDSQVGPDRRNAMTAYLKGAPEDAARVEAWRSQNEAIRAMFAGPELEPVPLWLTVGQIASGQDRLVSLPRAKARPSLPRSMPSRTRSTGRQPNRVVIVAAAVAFLAGAAVSAGAMQMMQSSRPVSPAARAERDVLSLASAVYALYGNDPDHAVEVAASAGGALRSWLDSRVGRPVPIPNLTRSGWVLRGGRLAEGPESPAAVLVYEGRSGERLMLYVTRLSQPIRESEVSAAESTLAWSDDGLGYALVTRASDVTPIDLEPLRELVTRSVRS